MEIIKGINPVYEFIKKSPQKIHKIIIKNNKKLNSKVFKIVKEAKKFNIHIQRVEKSFFSKYKNSQGVLAEVNLISLKSEKELLKKLEDTQLIIAFDGIQDPRNLGAIIRSAWFFGIDTIVLPSKRATAIGSAVSKSSAGAITNLQPYRVKNIPAFLKLAKDKGYKVVCAEGHGRESIRNFKKTGKFVLLFGSEDKGISSEPKKYCDFSVKIESQTNFESLNLSVSVSIFLYEFTNESNI